MVVWRSVVRQRIGIFFLIIEFSVLLQPSYSIAFEDVTSVTCTRLNSIIKLVFSSKKSHISPSDLDCHIAHLHIHPHCHFASSVLEQQFAFQYMYGLPQGRELLFVLSNNVKTE